jgi:NitT/TauT family transport system ATP-binding protein
MPPEVPTPRESGLTVRVQGARRVFPGGVEAVGGVSLDVPPGELCALLGPSGCGKSTLLRLVAGLERPDAGTVELVRPAGAAGVAAGPGASGPVVPGPGEGARHTLAFVFQDAHLLPWRTVLDNVALPLELSGAPAAERRAVARATLERVGLADAALRVPAELSGGMRMRASLARALVTSPRLLLLDEPFAALDELSRHRLDDMLRRLWLDLGVTILFVTHSISEAVYLAERAVVFSKRPARLVADVRIDLPRERTADLRADPAFARASRELLARLEEAEA